MTYPTPREQVRAVLVGAGFKAREGTTPSRSSRGTFDLKAGEGVLVEVAWWDAGEGERAELLARFAVALREAGFAVEDRSGGLYVADNGKDAAKG